MVELSLTSPCKWGSCFCVRGGLVLYVQDQYINHMNETGASVSLRGRGSGTSGLDGEGGFVKTKCLLSIFIVLYINF